MNSSLEKSKARDVVLNGDLLKYLKQKVGVRYMLTQDQFSGEHLSAYIFGSSITSGRFFWVEVSASAGGGAVSCGGRVNFEVWDKEGPDELIAKFARWESMKISHPWWNGLVHDRLFIGVHAVGLPLRGIGEISAIDQRLSLFHGLLVARLEAHLRDLESMAGKEPELLRPRADLFKQLVIRFKGFVSETRDRQLAASDPVA